MYSLAPPVLDAATAHGSELSFPLSSIHGSTRSPTRSLTDLPWPRDLRPVKPEAVGSRPAQPTGATALARPGLNACQGGEEEAAEMYRLGI